MKTSAYGESEDAVRDDRSLEPEEPIFTKVQILHADRFERVDEDRWDDAPSSPPAEKPAEWKASQASLAGSEVSVAREWRDIVSPTVDADPKREHWKDSQASLASSELSVQRDGREAPEERWSDTLASPPSSDVSAPRGDARERWSDCRSPPDDAETTDSAVPQEPSEMYYTASSEVSLMSDTELQERAVEKGDKKECVIAGHVAAMRERFESMTRANTPCPDLMRSSSPSLDVFRNVTPSPDRLG